jgi:hypothetical protein
VGRDCPQIRPMGGELDCKTTSLTTFRRSLQFHMQLRCWESAAPALVG